MAYKCEICKFDMRFTKEYKNNILKSVLKMLKSIFCNLKAFSFLCIHSIIIYFFTKRISTFLYESLNLLKKSFNPEAIMKLCHNITIFISILVGLKDIYVYYSKIFLRKRMCTMKFLPRTLNNS